MISDSGQVLTTYRMYSVKHARWPVRDIFVVAVLYIRNLVHAYKRNIYITFGTKELKGAEVGVQMRTKTTN